MSDRFKQCELTKSIDGGTARMVSWIPERIALAGAVVRLKDAETGDWTPGWTVASASGPTVAGKLLERHARDHLRTRRASDI